MAEELDDGELWLPSNIFSDVGLTHQRGTATTAGHELSHLNVFSRERAAFALLHRHQFPQPKPPPTPSSSSVAHRYRTRVLSQTSPPSRRVVLHYPLSHVRRAPVAMNMVATKATVSGQQQHQWQSSTVAGARVFPPLRPVVAGSGRTTKVCAGTGVFLPRVSVDVTKKKSSSSLRSAEQQQQEIRAAAEQGMSASSQLYQHHHHHLHHHYHLPKPPSSSSSDHHDHGDLPKEASWSIFPHCVDRYRDMS